MGGSEQAPCREPELRGLRTARDAWSEIALCHLPGWSWWRPKRSRPISGTAPMPKTLRKPAIPTRPKRGFPGWQKRMQKPVAYGIAAATIHLGSPDDLFKTAR
jgi:hypothetical protein